MNTRELMIGDWYSFRGHPYKCTASDIASIAECEEKGAPTDISEIPLTTEILDKNGFENDFYEEESIADYHTIRLEGYSLKHNIGEIDEYLVTWCNGRINITTDVNGCVQKNISYVHELQHAFRLCGIEKEITL